MKPIKLRSVEDVLRIVKDISEQHRLDTQLVDKTTKVLSKVATKVTASESFKILDFSGSKGPARKRTINIDFPIVSAPMPKELMHSYALAESLSEKYKYLVNLENEMNINFADMSNNSKIKVAKGEISKLKDAIEKDLRRLFATLNAVADGHAPKAYLNFVKVLAQELVNNKHLDCEGGRTVTYAAIGKPETGIKSNLVFAGYIILTNVIADDGRVAPNLYIVVRWTVGGNVEIFVEHDFIAPSLLQGGTTVENLRDALKAVTDQLTLEGFSSQLGNLPLDVQLRLPESGLRPGMFSMRDLLEFVSADTHELTFKVKRQHVKDIPTIKLNLFGEVKAMLKNKRNTTIRMSVSGQNIVFTFAGLDNTKGIHPNDLDFLSTKYKLANSQLRKIANIINGE